MESGYPIIRDLKSVVGIDGNVLFQAQEFQTHVNPGQSCEAQGLYITTFFQIQFLKPSKSQVQILGWIDR